MLTLLLPIGKYPFFAKACLKNIEETCGYALNEFDFVFLTSLTVEPSLLKTIEELCEEYPCRHLAAPFEAGYDHLQLLDWAFYEADVEDWVMVQHCDLFWRRNNWMKKMVARFWQDVLVVTPEKGLDFARFNLHDKPVFEIGDFCSVFNQRRFVEADLTFRMGTLGTEVPVSPEVEKLIRSGDIRWRKTIRSRRNPPSEELEFGVDMIDGSEALSLEVAARDLGIVRTVNLLPDMVHFWQFFRTASRLTREGSTLRVNRKVALDRKRNLLKSVGIYSWMTSFLFEKEDVAEPFPWFIFSSIAERMGVSTSDVADECRWLENYSAPKNPIGGDDPMGIRRVEFLDESFPVTSKLLL